MMALKDKSPEIRKKVQVFKGFEMTTAAVNRNRESSNSGMPLIANPVGLYQTKIESIR